MTFTDLGLRPDLAQTVAELGYDAPSPIQTALIPVLLAGRDAVGQARTGTGKTAAFALPMIERLANDNDVRAADPASRGAGTLRGLILCPTRELAVQVATAVQSYGRGNRIGSLPVVGGTPYGTQIRRLQRGVDVVVATPGRLVDLMNQGAVDLSAVQMVVLDEADEMFSMGFADDLEVILGAVPAARQTALLSATMPAPVRRLADKTLRDPQTVAVGETSGDKTAEDVEQHAFLVPGRDKFAALVRLLEMEDVTSALVFVRTRAATTGLAADLQAAGYAAEPLSGEMSQGARTDVLTRFRNQAVTLLVATDVAARGLDVDHVSHVFNMDLPVDVEAYVHRVGRTGRAGRSGMALSLVAPTERGLMRRIEGYAKRAIPFSPLPSVEAVEARRAERFAAALAASFEQTTEADRAHVLALVAEGHDPLEIAAAGLAFARAATPQAPLLPVQDVRPRPERGPRLDGFERDARPGPRRAGGTEPGMVRLALSAGHAHGVRPNMVVSAIARSADIPGRALGKIVIEDGRTLVDVPEDLAPRVLERSGEVRFGPTLARVEPA